MVLYSSKLEPLRERLPRKTTPTTFTDPRSKPDPSDAQPGSRTTSDPKPLRELHQLCREGRLYGVEDWIREEGEATSALREC